MSGQAMTEEPEGLLYRPDVIDPGEWAWQHSIPPTKALRYSVTFRSLRRR